MTITAEIGTSGTMEHFEPTSDVRHDLARAVDLEHAGECPNTCDIHVANKAGYPVIAAWLLFGATETPLLEAVAAHHNHSLHDIPRELLVEFAAECPSVPCPSCGAYVYGDDWGCGNCGATLPRPSEEEDE